jgi:hypothetical protein
LANTAIAGQAAKDSHPPRHGTNDSAEIATAWPGAPVLLVRFLVLLDKRLKEIQNLRPRNATGRRLAADDGNSPTQATGEERQIEGIGLA